jgi:hypothetical protein
MRIIVRVDDPTIRAAAKLIEDHCRDRKFMQSVADVKKFNHTSLSPVEVAQGLYVYSYDMEIIIEGYKSALPWSKAIGHAKGNTVFINTRKLNALDLYERCGNIYHEFCHLAGFSHDGNRVTPYNLETVPYKVGKLFEDYIKGIMDQKIANVGNLKS